MSELLVIGHRNPDTDAICSAIAYAEFKRQTGCAVIINTSFNVRGEPIVCSPEDAYRCFLACDMDVLVLENAVLLREDQPQLDEATRKKYMESFSLD